jgi:endonuclease YncB( thermonuclease family)
VTTAISEQGESLEVETVTQQQSVVEVADLEKEQLLLELVGKGWLFRLKDAKGKKYLCARNTGKEHSLGPFNETTKQIIMKNRIAVQGFNENQN